jgi:hypothetical protein
MNIGMSPDYRHRFHIMSLLITLAVVCLIFFKRKQYPTYWTGWGKKLGWKYSSRQKQVGGGWCCGPKANPIDTAEVDPPQSPSTKDERE